MFLDDAIGKRIKDLCNEKGISPYMASRKAGLPDATVRCIFYGRSKNVGTRTIKDLCEALDITIYDFFNDPMFKDKELEGRY